MLFADVRGYTKLTESLAPAEVPALVNRFYEHASAALLRHEGLLGQIEGDNVMGLFVPGLAGREYRRQAVEGGIGLMRAVGPESDLALEIGIGIATGEEFVGNVGGGGYKDFAAVGDVTNLAARLTAQAAGREILVDEATYEEVREEHPHAERRELELKGKGIVTVHVIRAH
ncbi:MAG: adenylate/guanylate cyclase domain-containing protein [Gaiellaceae bacterium]